MAWSAQAHGQAVPNLNPTELFSKRKTRDTSRLKAYNQILSQIHTRILKASRELADPYILYTVPPFVLGLPRLDLEDCIVYIVYQLRQQSYMVLYKLGTSRKGVFAETVADNTSDDAVACRKEGSSESRQICR